MPFAFNLRTRPDNLRTLVAAARDAGSAAARFIQMAEANSVSTGTILALLSELRSIRVSLATVPITRDFATYVSGSLKEEGYEGDPVADMQALREAVAASGAAIVAMTRNLWTGFAINPDTWATLDPTFTPAQTASLRAALAGVIAAVSR